MNSHIKIIKDTIAWTKSRAMECMSGKMDGFIREILITISGLGSENCMMEKNLSIEAIGRMANRLMTK